MRAAGVRTGKLSGISVTAAGGTPRPFPGVMTRDRSSASRSAPTTCADPCGRLGWFTIPARSEITDDTPLRLEVAAALAYPGGGMTASGFRRERDAGRLKTEMTAVKEFTTLAAIDRMRELCLGRRRPPQSPVRTDAD